MQSPCIIGVDIKGKFLLNKDGLIAIKRTEVPISPTLNPLKPTKRWMTIIKFPVEGASPDCGIGVSIL